MQTQTNKPGFLLPLVLVMLAGLLVYSTLVMYQAYYAYTSVLMQYHAYRKEYAMRFESAQV